MMMIIFIFIPLSISIGNSIERSVYARVIHKIQFPIIRDAHIPFDLWNFIDVYSRTLA